MDEKLCVRHLSLVCDEGIDETLNRLNRFLGPARFRSGADEIDPVLAQAYVATIRPGRLPEGEAWS